MSFTVDTSDLRQYGVNLGKVAASTLEDVDAVAKKGAQNIKDDLVSEAEASTHFRHMAGAISYDSKYGLGSVGYEIGPDKARRGGALGNIAYFGTSRGGGTLDIDGPLAREAPQFENEMAKLVDRLAGGL